MGTDQIVIAAVAVGSGAICFFVGRVVWKRQGRREGKRDLAEAIGKHEDRRAKRVAKDLKDRE